MSRFAKAILEALRRSEEYAEAIRDAWEAFQGDFLSAADHDDQHGGAWIISDSRYEAARRKVNAVIAKNPLNGAAGGCGTDHNALPGSERGAPFDSASRRDQDAASGPTHQRHAQSHYMGVVCDSCGLMPACYIAGERCPEPACAGTLRERHEGFSHIEGDK